MKTYRSLGAIGAATLAASMALVAPPNCKGVEAPVAVLPNQRSISVVTANYLPARQSPTVTPVRWGYRGYRPYPGRTYRAYRPYAVGRDAYYRPYGAYRPYVTRPYVPYVYRPYVYGYRPSGYGYYNYNPWYFGFGPQNY
jgi:hypothetical protein